MPLLLKLIKVMPLTSGIISLTTVFEAGLNKSGTQERM